MWWTVARYHGESINKHSNEPEEQVMSLSKEPRDESEQEFHPDVERVVIASAKLPEHEPFPPVAICVPPPPISRPHRYRTDE